MAPSAVGVKMALAVRRSGTPKRSVEAEDWQRLYTGKRWRRMRARFLGSHPFCVFCGAKGVRTWATVVDHVRPHRGDMYLFWDQGNWQALCWTCHSSTKQRLERYDTLPRTGVDGWPEAGSAQQAGSAGARYDAQPKYI